MKIHIFICKPQYFYFILLSMKQKQRKSPEQPTRCSRSAHSKARQLKPTPRPQELQKKKAKRKKTMVDFELFISCMSAKSYFIKYLSNINNILESDGCHFPPANLTCCTLERSIHGSVECSTNATKLAC